MYAASYQTRKQKVAQMPDNPQHELTAEQNSDRNRNYVGYTNNEYLQETTETPFPTDLSTSHYLTPWADLIDAQPAAMLIDGLIPQAQTTWLYGPTGIGKSLVALQIAIDLAHKRAVFGRLASQPVNVLWLDYENGHSETRTRLEAYGEDLYGLAATKHLHFGIMPPAATENPQHLLNVIEWLDIGLLIIDSSGVGIEGDSNSADTYSDFAKHLLNPLKRENRTTLVLDNMGKDPKKQAIGSSRKLHEAGAAWELKEQQQNLYQLTSRKTRTLGIHKAIALEKTTEPLAFRIVGEQGATQDILTPDQQNIVIYLDSVNGLNLFPNRQLKERIREAGFSMRDTEMDAAIRWWNRGNHSGIT